MWKMATASRQTLAEDLSHLAELGARRKGDPVRLIHSRTHTNHELPSSEPSKSLAANGISRGSSALRLFLFASFFNFIATVDTRVLPAVTGQKRAATSGRRAMEPGGVAQVAAQRNTAHAFGSTPIQ